MNKLIHAVLSLVCLSIFSFVSAQDDTRLAQTKMPLEEVALLQLSPLDNEALLETEMAARRPGRPQKFAESRTVDVNPDTHGSWSLTETGKQVWRLRISSPGAKTLNLGFDAFKMPAGASLMLYTPDYGTVMGPFTPADNEDHGELWTPILPGDELVVELQLPAYALRSYALHLKSVNHDFLGFGDIAALSGSCNVDVICGDVDGYPLIDRYRDIIQSVAVYSTGGATICTGFLVSNARQDCTPFFMTANHCGVGNSAAPSLVVYWNYLNSTCRAPNSTASGRNGDGQLNDFNTGAIHRASYSPSDFTLLELDDPVSPTADAWFAGWDARDVVTTDTVICVHHPNTEEKRISFEYDGLTRSNDNGQASASGNMMRVADWDVGTTEGGSSGSPLFNKQGRVVGQLYGGFAACGNDEYDVFGWLNISWTGGGDSSNRLRDWLDPDNTGTLQQDGYSQTICSFFVEGAPVQQTICAPEVGVYQVTVSSAFTSTVNLSVAGLPNGLQAAFVNPNLMPGGSTALQISGTENVNSGTYTFVIMASDGTNNQETAISISIDTGLADVPSLTMPSDGAMLSDIVPLLNWSAITEAFVYEVQMATDNTFNNLVYSIESEANSYQSSPLTGGNTYFWRVRSRNACGASEWSTVNSFSLTSEVCGQVAGEDTPVTIDNGPANTIESTVSVSTTGVVTSIRLRNLDISHSFVGDLQGSLRSPRGTTIQLFNRPNGGNCSRNNMLITLDDEASQTAADLVATCTGNPAVSGTFQPVDPFSTLIGEDAAGEWTLTIRDNAGDDGGSLNEWFLDICVNAEGLPDLTISPELDNVSACLLDNLELGLTLGTDFGDSPTVSVTSSNGDFSDFTSTFITETRTLMMSWTNFVNNTAGSYPLTIIVEGEGYSNSTSVNLDLQTAPQAADLQTPAADGQVGTNNIMLSWLQVGDTPVDSYIVEVADDELFTNILVQENTNLNNLSFDLAEEGLYYWRVTARNECGQSVSDFRRFEALLVGTYELGPAALRIFPNPTHERVQMELSSDLGGELNVQLHATDGKLVRQWQLSARAGRQSLELGALPAGVYWLRVRSGDRQAIEKLVVY